MCDNLFPNNYFLYTCSEFTTQYNDAYVTAIEIAVANRQMLLLILDGIVKVQVMVNTFGILFIVLFTFVCST